MIKYLILLLTLFCASASAQTLTLLETPDGKLIGVVKLPDGQSHFLPPTSITFIRVPKPDPTPDPVTTKVDRVTYVYEKDQGAVFPNARVALIKLNADKKVTATEFEDDTVDGDRQVPDQYKIALAKARDVGLPCLVVQSGSNVVKTMKVTAATTTNEILEVAK